VKVCETCGAKFKPRKPTSTTCSPRCRNARTSRLSAAKRAATQRGRGDGKAYRKHLGRHEHRVVMEQMIGRSLRAGEVVHHIDGNKLNNDPANLQLFASQAEHARHHGGGPRSCGVPGCGRPYVARDMCRTHYNRWKRTGKRVPA
jgi:hypothetical protein